MYERFVIYSANRILKCCSTTEKFNFKITFYTCLEAGVYSRETLYRSYLHIAATYRNKDGKETSDSSGFYRFEESV